MTGDTGRNGFLLNRGRGSETVAGNTLLQVGVQGGENRIGCRLGLSHDCVGRSFGDAVVISSASIFDIMVDVFCVGMVVCHGFVFVSGSGVIAVVGVCAVFGVVFSDFVIMLRSGFSVLVNCNCSLFGIGFVVVLIGVLIKIHLRIMIVTFFTGSSGVTKMSRHEISISFSVETGSKPIMPAERRGLVNPPEKNRPGSIDQSQNYDFQS